MDGWKYINLKVDNVFDVNNNAVLDRIVNDYGWHNNIRFKFTDDQGPQNTPFFVDNNVYGFGLVSLTSGGTGPDQVLSEFGGNLILAEEDANYSHAEIMASIVLPGYRGSSFTQTAFKFWGLIENIDQDYTWPWKLYSYEHP